MKPFSGRLMNHRIPSRVITSLVVGLSLVLLGAVLRALPHGDDETGRQAYEPVDTVHGVDAEASPRPRDATKKAAVKRLERADWPKAASAKVRVTEAGRQRVRGTLVGGLPVTVTRPAGRTKRDVPRTVRVTTLGHARAERLHTAVLLNVTRADAGDQPGRIGLTVDYTKFAEAYGGSYGDRLRLVELPPCAAQGVPGSRACPELPTPLRSSNDGAENTVTAEVTAYPSHKGLSAQGAEPTTLLALSSGTSSDKGDYKATTLSPSADWNVSPSSGGFSWNYPFRTIPVPGGLRPSVGLSYSSQAVDGRTAVTNNQGSWIGEGFSFEPGYIERRYQPCAEDGHENSAEQCWAFENATLLLNGSSSQLVRDDETGEWHLTGENGSRVEHLTGGGNGDNNGEHWRVTTIDGTEYYFGLNRLPGWAAGDEETNSTWTAPVFGDDSGDPCYDSTFAAAHCRQAWRWSLDYVKDTHGNVMSYWYKAETNHYALNGKTDVDGTAYHRGGYLKRIDYGQRDGDVYDDKAPARVKFSVVERCKPTETFDCAPSKRNKANASYWPDVPMDLQCKAGTHCGAGQTTTSFWTTKRLTGITTQMWDGESYQDVDAWTLVQRFTDNGDDSKTLWLAEIGHEGRVDGSAEMPSVEFQPDLLENRVDKDGDNIDAFHRYRLGTVLTETGAQLDINYAPTECTPDALPAPGHSTKRCYPVRWTPPGHIEPITDWFHKYVVAEIVQTDRTGGGAAMHTWYDYQGDAAWRHAEPDGITDEKFLTWSQWQGYGDVSVTSGGEIQNPSTRVDYTYLQGMDGDKDPDGGTRNVTVTDSTGVEYTDHKEFTGLQVEAVTYDGDKVVSKVVTEPWKHRTATQTDSWNTRHATIVKSKVTRGYKKLSDGTWRETKSVSTYDTDTDTGRLLRTEDLKDLATTEDDQCTRLWYADSPSENIYSLPSRSEAVSVDCSAAPDRATQVIADERVSYDGKAFGEAPSAGDATKTERMTSHDGSSATYQVTGTTTYDVFGRPTAQTDASGATTTTEYTDVNGLISQTKVTNARGHVTTTDYAAAWGQSLGQTDPNGRRTDLEYDPLGRLISVWLPNRDKNHPQTPSIKYSYDVRKDKVTSITTEKIENDGTYGTEQQLYDSLLRPRQKQTEGPGGTRMVADTFYGPAGKISKVNKTYNAAGEPSGELLTVPDSEIDAQTRYVYDGLGRTTDAIFLVDGVEQWRTTTAYEGERTHVDPPQGGTPTTTIDNVDGLTVELRHWQGEAPNPTGEAGPGNGYDATKYTYTPAGDLETVTDAQDNVWRYEYDQLGRKVKSIDPDAGTTVTEYDALDRPVTTIDARNKRISTEYDELGRVTARWQGEPETGTKLTETRYDKEGWLGKAWATFRFVNGGSDYYAKVIQGMDEFYRPSRTAYSVPASEGALAGVYPFTKTYYDDGTVGGIGMPAAGGLGSEPISFTYDELQRPIGMHGKADYASAIYTKLSQLKTLTLSAGDGPTIRKSFQYEKGTERLTSSEVKLGDSAKLRSANYTYDQAGNVLSIADTDGTSPDVQCFSYDTRERLAEAWTPAATAVTAAGRGTVGSANLGASKPSACTAAPGQSALGGPAPYWKSYTTDAIGNRTRDVTHDLGLDPSLDVTRTFTYGEANAGPHAVTKVVSETPTGDRQSTYAYDPTGNTTARTIGGDTQTLEWNAEGKLIRTTEADGRESTSLYGADGNRVVRRDAEGTTVYLPGMELRLDKGSGEVKATRYYSFAGQTIAVRTNDGELSFLASDHQGTAQLAIDAATGGVAQRRFDPYGMKRGQDAGQWPGEKGFVGGTIDAQTGLTHVGAREYDAGLGKFISVDPIIDYTEPQQINGYAYADNSPVTYSDPTGLVRDIGRSGGTTKDDGTGPNDGTGGVAGAAADVAAAEASYASSQQKVTQAISGLVEIGKELLGVNAALDCFSSGDLAACGETILNVAGSFAGGLAGKILAKYGAPWNWAKAAKLVKKVWGLAEDLIGGIKGMWNAKAKLGKARDALAVAKARAKTAAAKAKAALKRPKGCPTRHSFLPGTLVLLSDGSTKSIEDVELGDHVTVTDPETQETATREVVGTIVTEDDKHFVDLTITIEDGGKTAALISTTTHPFWSDSEQRWIDAGNLRPGTTLHTPDGDPATVTDVRHFTKRQRTHDLTISGIHTYYVLAGATPVLVHNCGGAVQGHPSACNCANGDTPKVRNGKLAGGTHPDTGVPFDADGFPDFSAWRHPQVLDVRIQLTGSRSKDFRLANQAAGMRSTPKGYTWHHHQDSGLMQLIDRQVHAKTGHTGGF